ncbi:Protein timeless [Nymphon striatum]|nr:Protein timeless [Nymphon striatum]
MDTSVFCAELTATCNALGYLDNDNYFKEPDCLITLKDMIRYLKHDGDDHEVRRHFGKNESSKLLVNLTNPAYLLYEEELPQEKHTRNHYLELLSHLESYKLSFTESAIWATLTNILGEILKLVMFRLESRQEEDQLVVERILMLIRNVLYVSVNPDVEMRTDDDATIHDQVLWALHLSGMEDLLLYICNSEQLASAGFTRSISEKEKDEQELLKLREKERVQKYTILENLVEGKTWHSNFGGTYVAKGIKALSNREMICHKPLSESQSLNFDRTKQSKTRPKNRRPVESADVYSPINFEYSSFLERRLFSMVWTLTEAHDETYYLWAMKFFMEFNRLHQFQVKLVSETISIQTFHYVQTQMDNYHEMMMIDKKKLNQWSRRDSILQMITSYDDTKHPKAYLKDLAETVHLFLKMLHQYCAKTSHLVVQRKKKQRKHRKKQKEKNQNKEQQQSDDNIPEDLWTSIADNLPSMLPEQHEIPSDLMPFDPTLDAEVDQKPIALFKIQKYLKEKELVRAIALLRASRDIWPDGDIFGAVGLPPEDEFLVLKEIFSADIPVPADILLPAVKAPGVVEFCLISSNFSEIPDTPLVLSA